MNQFRIYLVWARTDGRNGPYDLENVDLRAVDTTKKKAEIHKRMIEDENRYITNKTTGVFIEERDANHCYGQRDVRLTMRMRTRDGENDWK